MPQRHWLVKSEPFKYSFEQLVREGRTIWDGVRNFEARNNLRAMAPGDLLLFYHSNEGLAVVGVARVAREAFPDPSAPDEDWSVVEVEPFAPLPEPVPLSLLRATPALASMAILRRSRLSVTPVTPAEFDEVLRLGNTDAKALARHAASAAQAPVAASQGVSATLPKAAVKAGAKAAKATKASGKVVSKAVKASGKVAKASGKPASGKRTHPRLKSGAVVPRGSGA
jgi:predicted RNA-binding protein with PUA-like domain